MRVAVIDPGSGNLASVARALGAAAAMAGLAAEVRLTRDPADVLAADRVVLPGQGAFAACRAGLFALPGMVAALDRRVLAEGRPFLGICVGLQLMAERGLEHGVTPGLGWLPGEVAPMDPRDAAGHPLPLPQMGWNRLQLLRPHPLLAGLAPDAHAYFVHSYAWVGAHPEHVIATTDYGGPVVAVLGRDNLVGTQFHVEKSGMVGLAILRNFLEWAP
ncbi:MAG: imidazole glycerol phosphate synthase subunit HisH [Rhodovarius sp.]|nr:imidazole glycerol phosphate synthase subunit HisH [Rhodovarius sp.]MCX7931305.1 imidazole glycerol phosphate synthase subunit HisH [Rhodovarius sp.]MDW8315826.1 imidazole glycerol phosphate synthase subunit HisH [Rhodovarius sp.]